MEYGPHRLLIAVLLAGLALTGCAGSDDRYPSLSIRDFERAPDASIDESPLQPRPASGELRARIEHLLGQASIAHDAFTAASPEAERMVSAAAGMDQEDNEWSAAQIALAELDSKRGTTSIALGDLDALYSNATIEFIARNGIAEARDKVATLIAVEDQTLERLRSRLDQ